MTYVDNTVTNPKLQRAFAKVTKQKSKNKHMILKLLMCLLGKTGSCLKEADRKLLTYLIFIFFQAY